MDEDGFVAILDWRISDIYCGTVDDITHHTATEDVMAVDSLDIDGGRIYRIVESATKDTAT